PGARRCTGGGCGRGPPRGRYRRERKSPWWIYGIALVGLLGRNGRKAGGGDGLAVTLLLLAGDVIPDALGDFGELGLEDFGGGGEDQIAARAGEHAAQDEEVAHLVEIGIGGDVALRGDVPGGERAAEGDAEHGVGVLRSRAERHGAGERGDFAIVDHVEGNAVPGGLQVEEEAADTRVEFVLGDGAVERADAYFVGHVDAG